MMRMMLRRTTPLTRIRRIVSCGPQFPAQSWRTDGGTNGCAAVLPLGTSTTMTIRSVRTTPSKAYNKNHKNHNKPFATSHGKPKNRRSPSTTNNNTTKKDFSPKDAVQVLPIKFPPGPGQVVVVCHPGLEGVVSQELKRLDIPHVAPPSSMGTATSSTSPPPQRRRPRSNTTRAHALMQASLGFGHAHHQQLERLGKPVHPRSQAWSSSQRHLLPGGRPPSLLHRSGVVPLKGWPTTLKTILSCHLHLGSASHVWIGLLPPHETCRALGELTRKVAILIPWAGFVTPSVRLSPLPGTSRLEGPAATPWRRPMDMEQSSSTTTMTINPKPHKTLHCRIRVLSTQGSRLTSIRAIRDHVIRGMNQALGHGGPDVDPRPEPVQLYLPPTDDNDQDDNNKNDKDNHKNDEPRSTHSEWNDNEDEDDWETRFSSSSHQTTPRAKPQQSSSSHHKPPSNLLCLVVNLVHDQLQVWWDTSSTPLHQRGYRLSTAKAPLREDLAHAMLYNAGWIPPTTTNTTNKTTAVVDPSDNPWEAAASTSSTSTSPEQPQEEASTSAPTTTNTNTTWQAFLDPFCGSGTLAIEAAAMRHGLAPGRLRPAPLAGTIWYEPHRWKTLTHAASTPSTTNHNHNHHKTTMIACSDRNPGALAIVQANAQRAGVQDLIHVQSCPLSAHEWLPKPKKKQKTKKKAPTTNVSDSTTMEEDTIREDPVRLDDDTIQKEQDQHDKEEWTMENDKEDCSTTTTTSLAHSDCTEQDDNDDSEDDEDEEEQEEDTHESEAYAMDDTQPHDSLDKQNTPMHDPTTLPPLNTILEPTNILSKIRASGDTPTEQQAHQQGLLIVTNPPFGRRIQSPSHKQRDDEDKQNFGQRRMERILPLFQTLKTRLDALNDQGFLYKLAILTDNEHTLKRAGLREVKPNLQFSHGGIFVSSMVTTNRIHIKPPKKNKHNNNKTTHQAIADTSRGYDNDGEEERIYGDNHNEEEKNTLRDDNPWSVRTVISSTESEDASTPTEKDQPRQVYAHSDP